MRQDGIRSPRPELHPIQGQLQKIIHVKYRGPAAVHAGKVYRKIRHPAGNRRKVPEYQVVDRSGPDHAAVFTVRVAVKGVGEAEASGASKQEAEKLAAAAFMEKFA